MTALASDLIRARLVEAFKLMRAAGFVARSNYQCCSGCAACAIAVDVGKKGKPISGAVFTTKQDMDADACRHIDRTNGACVYVKFGPVNYYGEDFNQAPRTFGFDSVTCGRALVEACTAAGLETVWSGKDHDCVGVRLPEAERVEVYAAAERRRRW